MANDEKAAGKEDETPEDEIAQLVATAIKEKRPVRLKLIEAVRFGDDGNVDELEFRQMRGKDWFEFPVDSKDQTIGHFLRAAGRLTAQPPKLIGDLASQDVRRVVQVVALLMQRGQ